MNFRLSDGQQLRLIAPFADMLNHSPDIPMCHIYDATNKTLRIVAGKDYEVGEQVCTFFLF
jgi:SET domain